MPTNIVIAIDDPSNIDGWGLRPKSPVAWSAGAYAEGTVVTHSGQVWLAQAQTSQTPGVGSDWESLIPSITGAAGAWFGQGSWNANTNTPPLASGVGTEGYVYRVSTAGTTTLDGKTDWRVGDLALFLDGAWKKIRTDVLIAADISDSSAAGRTVLTAANAAAQRTALGVTATVAQTGSFLDLINRPASMPRGRLTLTTGVPVLTSTVSGAGTVYFTPYGGATVPVWDGSAWVDTAFTERSQALTDATKSPAAAGANSNYDLFVWNDGGTLRCTRGPAWSSDTSRGTGAGTTELQTVGGYLCNKVAITNGPGAGAGLYVGSVRTNGSSTVDWTLGTSAAGGGAASLGVWNQFNRVEILTRVQDSNAGWAYTTASWRSADNSTTNRISAVFGGTDESHEASYTCVMAQSGANTTTTYVGIGVDSTSSPSGVVAQHNSGGVAVASTPRATAIGNLLGFHFFQAIEYGATGMNFGGNSAQGLALRARM
jgi:hypothetical protein